MRVALLSREYPLEVYGGASVHVEYLARELRAAGGSRGALLGERSVRMRGRIERGRLLGEAPHLAALQAMSVDLVMAAGLEGAAVAHSHTW